jgi:hypothetical protein
VLNTSSKVTADGLSMDRLVYTSCNVQKGIRSHSMSSQHASFRCLPYCDVCCATRRRYTWYATNNAVVLAQLLPEDVLPYGIHEVLGRWGIERWSDCTISLSSFLSFTACLADSLSVPAFSAPAFAPKPYLPAHSSPTDTPLHKSTATMASQSTTSDAALQELHAKATSNVAAKLDRVPIPRRFLPDGLTIDDIYSHSAHTRVPIVPRDLQLPFLFANHNALSRLNRFASLPSTEHDFNNIRALFFWGLDRNHAFGSRYKCMRYNMVLMLLVFARPELQQYIKPGALDFLRAFLTALMEEFSQSQDFTARESFVGLWADGRFEFVCFKSSRLKLIQKTLKTRDLHKSGKEKIWQAFVGEEEFVGFMQGLSPSEVEVYGPVLTLSWMAAKVRVIQGVETEQHGEQTGIEGMFATLDLSKPSEYDLEHVDWEDELVRNLLVDIDQEAKGTTVQFNTGGFWMDADTAVKILVGEYINVPTPDVRDGEGELAPGAGDAMEE